MWADRLIYLFAAFDFFIDPSVTHSPFKGQFEARSPIQTSGPVEIPPHTGAHL